VAYQFDFDATHKIIRGRFAGRVTDEEIKNYYREATAYGEMSGALAGVTDFSAATSFAVSRETVIQLAAANPALADPKATRIIIASLPGLFGMARMFEIAGERTRPNLHIVRTEQEAWAVLGVWNPKFEPLNYPAK
jgi:hypothetical protein